MKEREEIMKLKRELKESRAICTQLITKSVVLENKLEETEKMNRDLLVQVDEYKGKLQRIMMEDILNRKLMEKVAQDIAKKTAVHIEIDWVRGTITANVK